MGVVDTVGYDRFPEQCDLGRTVRVCFDYDPGRQLDGVVVREDAGPPGEMIIRLEDGRHVLSTECQYSEAR